MSLASLSTPKPQVRGKSVATARVLLLVEIRLWGEKRSLDRCLVFETTVADQSRNYTFYNHKSPSQSSQTLPQAARVFEIIQAFSLSVF